MSDQTTDPKNVEELLLRTDNGPRPEDGEQPDEDLQRPVERTDFID